MCRNPLWGVGLILLGLQSFFYENTSTTGALHGVSSAEKRRLAAKSLTYNLRNPTFRKLFPELLELHDQLERKKTEEVEPTPPQTEGLGRVEAGPGRGPLTGGFLQEVNGLEAPKHQLGWRTLVLGSVLALAAAATLGILMAIDS